MLKSKLLNEDATEDDFFTDTSKVRRGDIIGVTGCPRKTKKVKSSIFPKNIKLLTPCLHILSHLHCGLKNKETRFRQGYLSLNININVHDNFVVRTIINT